MMTERDKNVKPQSLNLMLAKASLILCKVFIISLVSLGHGV